MLSRKRTTAPSFVPIPDRTCMRFRKIRSAALFSVVGFPSTSMRSAGHAATTWAFLPPFTTALVFRSVVVADPSVHPAARHREDHVVRITTVSLLGGFPGTVAPPCVPLQRGGKRPRSGAWRCSTPRPRPVSCHVAHGGPPSPALGGNQGGETPVCVRHVAHAEGSGGGTSLPRTDPRTQPTPGSEPERPPNCFHRQRAKPSGIVRVRKGTDGGVDANRGRYKWWQTHHKLIRSVVVTTCTHPSGAKEQRDE